MKKRFSELEYIEAKRCMNFYVKSEFACKKNNVENVINVKNVINI